MKIGILSSHYDSAVLFNFLAQYSHEYYFYCDWQYNSHYNLDFNSALQKVHYWVKELLENGCEKVIVSPVFELILLKDRDFQSSVLPLFTDYLMTRCLPFSKVWKLWFLSPFDDQTFSSYIDNSIIELLSTYRLTSAQESVKKFQKPLSLWIKSIKMWNQFLRTLPKRGYLSRHIIVEDLRYLKDAWVDTIIPLDYGFFSYQKILSQRVSAGCNFFGLSSLSQSFDFLTKDSNKSDSYRLFIISNWSSTYLSSHPSLYHLLRNWDDKNIVLM